MLPTATGIKVKPIVVMTLPVTSGGKNFRILENIPEIRITIIPDTIIEPKIAPEPNLAPIIDRGATHWKATPKTTGRPIPKYLFTCNCKNVAKKKKKNIC